MQEQILAALKKLGPSSPGQVADHLGEASSSIGYHLKRMLDAGTIKAQGATSGRRIALPDQDFGAPPSAPTKGKKKHRKAKHAKARKAPTPRAQRAATPAERFIPTVDAERRLVIVNAGEPLIFNDEQTAAIATLLFTHYDKE